MGTIAGVAVMTAAYAGGNNSSQDPSSSASAQTGSVQTGAAIPVVTTKPAKPTLEPVTAVTFANDQGTTYILARELAKRLGQPIEMAVNRKSFMIGDKKIEKFRQLYAGDVLIAVRDVAMFEGTLDADPLTRELTISLPQGDFQVTMGKKRIEVDKATQEMTAYQGDLMVMKTNVSTGRPGHNTPNGNFETGPKERMHYSRKYDNAPMPYAIQVNGDIFFHGYSSVPSYPASHGCIRLPLYGKKNAAKYLFGWVESGVETKIYGTFSWESRSKRRNKRRY